MDRDDALYELRRRRSVRRRLDLILRVYSWVGLLVAILGGVYFLLTLIPIELSTTQQTSLMVAGIGIVLSFMSRAMMIVRKERALEELETMKQYESLASFLDAWTQFERTGKEALAKEQEDFRPHSLRLVISRLHQEGKLDSTDVAALEEALQARNSIVHGERPLSSSVADRVMKSLVEITRKLSAS